MEQDVKIPSAGESISEVDLLEWKKKNGSTVAKDEILVELETDKATLELRAPCDGTLKIKRPSGTTVKVGEVVATVNSKKVASENPIPEKPVQSDPKIQPNPTKEEGEGTTPVEIRIPNAGESIVEADILEWFKQTEEMVKKDELILEIETEKASLEIRAPESGQLKIIKKSGTVKIDEVVGTIDSSKTVHSVKEKAPVTLTFKDPSEDRSIPSHDETDQPTTHPTPASRKLIQEKEVPLNQITPSGRGGRIMKEDVLKAIENTPVDRPDGMPQTTTPSRSLEDRNKVKKKMSRLRRTIAQRLVQSQQTAALLTTFNEVDMNQVITIRRQYKEKFKQKHEVNLGFMSFFVRATCQAISDFPIINSMIEEEEIINHGYVDLGIAVSTPKGLIVPIIRDAQKKSFQTIEKTILDFALRGKEGKIDLDEMTGGTFTITNGGTFGSMLSTPIINFPQSAILGMHNIVERATVVNHEIVIRPIMYLALSYDHRLIDGADAVKFLYRIKELIEDPYRLLIDI